MNARTIIAAIAILTVSLARAEELKRLSLDDASFASPRIEADAAVKTEGRGSIKITARWPVTVCLGEVTNLQVENAALVYTAKVRTELDGTAYLEMCAHVGGGQYFSKGLNDTVGGRKDWKTIQTPFIFQQGQKPDKVTLNIVINGKGVVWVDDVVLSRKPLN